MAGRVEEDVKVDDDVFDGVLDHCTGIGGAAAAAALAFSTASLAAAAAASAGSIIFIKLSTIAFFESSPFDDVLSDGIVALAVVVDISASLFFFDSSSSSALLVRRWVVKKDIGSASDVNP